MLCALVRAIYGRVRTPPAHLPVMNVEHLNILMHRGRFLVGVTRASRSEVVGRSLSPDLGVAKLPRDEMPDVVCPAF